MKKHENDFNKNTLVINLFAGPSAGKTTAAWEIASTLKKADFSVEYVSEYAKELVYDEKYELLDGKIKHEELIMLEKIHRIERLCGKVDFVVTDSPIIQSVSFLDKSGNDIGDVEKFTEHAISVFNEFDNYNAFIERGTHFEKEGRIHNLEESIKLDDYIKNDLASLNVPYKCYGHDEIIEIIEESINARENITATIDDIGADIRPNNKIKLENNRTYDGIKKQIDKAKKASADKKESDSRTKRKEHER